MLYPPANASADLAIDKRTCISPLHKRTSGPITALHLFGAWGGWSFAGQILSELGHEVTSAAIEIDFDSARSNSLTHRCPLLTAGDDDVLPALALASFPSGWCLCADIMDPSWYEAVAFWAPEIVTISSPCPPWSGAAMQQGLHSSDGQLLMRSIALCKILRPKIILIEQVAGFHAHPHRQWIQRALWFAGYHLRFSHDLELGDLMAPKRSRWLGVAYMVHKWPPAWRIVIVSFHGHLTFCGDSKCLKKLWHRLAPFLWNVAPSSRSAARLMRLLAHTCFSRMIPVSRLSWLNMEVAPPSWSTAGNSGLLRPLVAGE